MMKFRNGIDREMLSMGFMLILFADEDIILVYGNFVIW